MIIYNFVWDFTGGWAVGQCGKYSAHPADGFSDYRTMIDDRIAPNWSVTS
jgi:hypothetical protein